MADSENAPHQSLRILLLRPAHAQSDAVIAQLEEAGFEVEADIVATTDALEQGMASGRYDLATSGIQLANAFRMLEQQRRRAYEEALEEGAKFQAMLETCPLGMMSLDLEGKVRMWNRGAEQMFGWRAEEVLGRELPTVLDNDREQHRRLLESQLQGASYVGLEARRQRKDGTVLDVSLWTVALRDGNGSIKGSVPANRKLRLRDAPAPS